MKKLIIKIIGVLLLICFLIYLFYSPRLKFDVLENPNKDATKTTQNKVPNTNEESVENSMPKEGIGTWVGQNLKKLTDTYGQAERVYSYKGDFKNYIFKNITNIILLLQNIILLDQCMQRAKQQR